ncbi:MAG: DUF5132 domain-containing protein [Bryobacterales bacterium]|nr:DUF5132 domain-containing protein [Bryobacterales bacterium]
MAHDDKQKHEQPHATEPRVVTPEQRGVQTNGPMAGESIAQKAATVALVGLGVALIEVEWIPGLLIGAAAMAAPNLLPRLGRAMRPLLKEVIRAGYSFAETARGVAAEAGEQVQDIVAEVRSERPAEPEPERAH